MKLLIVYGSTEGQTRKICEFLRDQAQKAGHSVTISDSTQDPPPPDNFDSVIIGASLHYEKYQDSVAQYVKNYHSALNQKPTAFISVSLTAANDEPESWNELKTITNNFLDFTHWTPRFTEQVAGALRYLEYNFLKKFIMRMIAKQKRQPTDTSKDYEYTDWQQVKLILKNLEKEGVHPKPTTA